MTDLADLIDGVIERQTRANLVGFLADYELIEFGRKRKLDASETALILTAVNRFLIDDSFAELGFTEFADLTGNLASIASMHDGQVGQRCELIRRCCFDALASIKAFEARLSRKLDLSQVARLARPMTNPSANEP